MRPSDLPIILLVCGDEQQRSALRCALRSGGFLTAVARSVPAALSLLTQVQVDGCVVCHAATSGEVGELARVLERMRPRCPKLLVAADLADVDLGWSTCCVAELPRHLAEHFTPAAYADQPR